MNAQWHRTTPALSFLAISASHCPGLLSGVCRKQNSHVPFLYSSQQTWLLPSKGLKTQLQSSPESGSQICFTELLPKLPLWTWVSTAPAATRAQDFSTGLSVPGGRWAAEAATSPFSGTSICSSLKWREKYSRLLRARAIVRKAAIQLGQLNFQENSEAGIMGQAASSSCRVHGVVGTWRRWQPIRTTAFDTTGAPTTRTTWTDWRLRREGPQR